MIHTVDPSRLTLERVEHAGGLAALREEWNELLAASAADGLFLTWEWLSHWWRHLSAGRRLSLTLVRAGGELVAIAPLAVRRRRVAGLLPVRSLEFLDDSPAVEYQRPVADPSDLVEITGDQ